MPSWKVRSNSSERAKSWITPDRQSAEAVTSMVKPLVPQSFPPQNAGRSQMRDRATVVPQPASRGPRAEQCVGRGPPGPLALELRLHPGDLGPQRLDALLQPDHAE